MKQKFESSIPQKKIIICFVFRRKTPWGHCVRLLKTSKLNIIFYSVNKAGAIQWAALAWEFIHFKWWILDELSFEKFMKGHLGRDTRDRFTQCSGNWELKDRQKEKTVDVFSWGLTLSSVDDSCAWGLFIFIYFLFTTYYTESWKVVSALEWSQALK